MDWRVILRRDVERAGLVYINESIKEIKDQGYNSSGKGVASLETEIEQLGLLEFKIIIKGIQYLIFLDTGTKPHFPPVAEIFKWVQQKGLGGSRKERRSIAFAIATNQAKIGTPNPNSFKFSSNGRRKNWIEFAQLAAQGKVEPIFRGSEWARAFFDQILPTNARL